MSKKQMQSRKNGMYELVGILAIKQVGLSQEQLCVMSEYIESIEAEVESKVVKPETSELPYKVQVYAHEQERRILEESARANAKLGANDTQHRGRKS